MPSRCGREIVNHVQRVLQALFKSIVASNSNDDVTSLVAGKLIANHLFSFTSGRLQYRNFQMDWSQILPQLFTFSKICLDKIWRWLPRGKGVLAKYVKCLWFFCFFSDWPGPRHTTAFHVSPLNRSGNKITEIERKETQPGLNKIKNQYKVPLLVQHCERLCISGLHGAI